MMDITIQFVKFRCHSQLFPHPTYASKMTEKEKVVELLKSITDNAMQLFYSRYYSLKSQTPKTPSRKTTSGFCLSHSPQPPT